VGVERMWGLMDRTPSLYPLCSSLLLYALALEAERRVQVCFRGSEGACVLWQEHGVNDEFLEWRWCDRARARARAKARLGWGLPCSGDFLQKLQLTTDSSYVRNREVISHSQHGVHILLDIRTAPRLFTHLQTQL